MRRRRRSQAARGDRDSGRRRCTICGRTDTVEVNEERLAEIETVSSDSTLKRKYGATIDDTGLSRRCRAGAAVADRRNTTSRSSNACPTSSGHSPARRQHCPVLAGERRRRCPRDRGEHRVAQDGQRRGQIAVEQHDVRTESRPSSTVHRSVRTTDRDRRRGDSRRAESGESPKPLGRIASGGETARIMLVQIGAVRARFTPTLVFDEIDVGVGGRTGRS